MSCPACRDAVGVVGCVALDERDLERVVVDRAGIDRLTHWPVYAGLIRMRWRCPRRRGAKPGVQILQHELLARTCVHVVRADRDRVPQLPLVSHRDLVRMRNHAIWIIERHRARILHTAARWIQRLEQRAVDGRATPEHRVEGEHAIRGPGSTLLVPNGNCTWNEFENAPAVRIAEISSKCVLS